MENSIRTPSGGRLRGRPQAAGFAASQVATARSSNLLTSPLVRSIEVAMSLIMVVTVDQPRAAIISSISRAN